MPEVDLSPVVPPSARWVKVHYEMIPMKPDSQLIARLWSGNMDDAVVIKGESGDAFVRLDVPQKISFQRPVTVELRLKVLAYKASADGE